MRQPEQEQCLAIASQTSSSCLTKAAGDRGVRDCRGNSRTAAGVEGLIRGRESGELLVMGAPSVVVARREFQAIGPGDSMGSERRLVQAPPAQGAAIAVLK